MKITDITAQKNKNKFNLFVDDNFYAGILKETAIANNFYVGKEISKETLDKILIESESKQAFSKASDYLSQRLHTQKELYLKLIKKGFSKQASINAIEKLAQYGYVDDKLFAQEFAKQNSKLSSNMIKSKLLSKGVDRDVINDVINAEEDFQNCLVCAEKYLKNKDKKDYKTKLLGHLARKGFSSADISKTINKIYNEDIYLEE